MSEKFCSAGVVNANMPLAALAYRQLATFCIKPGCGQCIFCASCTQTRRVNHRHKTSTFVVTMVPVGSLPAARQPELNCYHCRKGRSKLTVPAFLHFRK